MPEPQFELRPQTGRFSRAITLPASFGARLRNMLLWRDKRQH
jgi:hypothetical protein